MILFNSEKHYNTLNNYYQYKYDAKVFKIPLNGNFTCPNLDGTVAFSGCTFCTPMGGGEFAGRKQDNLKAQFNKTKKMMHLKWPSGKYIPYFQANTNTHAPLEKLQELFETAITLNPDIVMISIGTRPDCLPHDVIKYLSDLNTRVPVQVELGLQTIHKTTADLINRAHDLETFNEAVIKLRAENIEVVVHIMNGLPYESGDMMLDTVKHLSTLDIQGLKIHMLHIMKNTKMGRDYLANPWHMLTLTEYVDVVVSQLRLLNPKIIIHRLTGDAPNQLLIVPQWTRKKFVTTNEIDKKMRKLNLFQGDLYENKHD